MPLPQNFIFSQGSLRDFETCPYRFKLRYIEQLRWPAIETEPVAEAERLARLGADFHRLAQQQAVGLDAALLDQSLSGSQPELRQWWANFQAVWPARLAGADCLAELSLSAPLRDVRLMARLDLLLLEPDGHFTIVDWKTTRRKPPRAWLERSLQSRVYPYLLAAAGAGYNDGRPIDPAKITMQYWYPEFPDDPEIFTYSPARQRWDEQFLSDLIEQIKAAAEADDFPRVEDDRPCRYCVYRSLCERGVSAGLYSDLAELDAADAEMLLPDLVGPDNADELNLDWEQIAEIQF